MNEMDVLRTIARALSNRKSAAALSNYRVLPLFVYGESKLHALIELRGAWEHQQGQPELDIAVIGLSERCADDLQARHWFASPEDVSVVKPKTPGLHYLIAGYPASRNKRRPLQFGLPSRAVALITGDICSVKTVQGVDKTEADHFATAFPHKTVHTPRGGSISSTSALRNERRRSMAG